MRFAILAAGLALAACASPAAISSSASLASADAATALIVGPSLTQTISTTPAAAGMDPLMTLTLRHSDGRMMAFQQGNHTPHDLMAQQPGGALAQIMGLFGEEAPVLYHATPAANRGAPFLCAPEGPAALGVHQNAGGEVLIVGLKQAIEFETRPDGQAEAIPFSPDQVCARLRFTGAPS
jgi:hypothetical protein